MKRNFAIGLILAAAAVSQAQTDYRVGGWGIRAGISFFTNSDMRDYFGNGKFAFGLSPITKTKSGNFQVATDIDFNIANENGNKLFVVPVTVGVTKSFGDAKTTMPYASVRAGLAYADYSITNKAAVRESSKRFIPTANAELGIVLSEKLKVAARYDWFKETDGFKFDSVQFSATYQLFRW